MLQCTLIVPRQWRVRFSPCPKKTEGDEEGEKNEVWAGDGEKKKRRKAGAMPWCLSEQGIHIQAEASGARLAHRTRRSPEDELACRKITADTAARVNISLPVCHSSGLIFHAFNFSKILTLTTSHKHQENILPSISQSLQNLLMWRAISTAINWPDLSLYKCILISLEI